MILDNIEDVYELSPTQHGMLFHTLSAPKSGVYSEQIIYKLRGEVNVAALEKAWQQAADRHPILRTSFFIEDLDKPVQLVHRRVTLQLEQQDWRTLSVLEQEKCLKSLLETDRERGFKLSEAPLMRLTLVRMSDGLHRFICHYHHAILDGWSYNLLLREVFTLYEGCLRGQRIELSPCRPYRDYIEWLHRQDLVEAEKYWRDELDGITAPNVLSIDKAPGSPADQHAVYRELSFQWSGNKMAALQSFARRSHLTVSTIVHGIWALSLSHYSGEKDVVFGTIVSGRGADLTGIDSMIGLFINTLPVRVRVSWDNSALPWLKRLQGQLVDLRQYEHSPLIEVQGWSEVPRGQPLFESIVVFENYPVEGSLECNGSFTIDDVRASPERTNYPITLLVVPGESLSVQIIFECRRFDPAAMANLLGHFENLLEAIIVNPEGRLSELPLLSEAERRQLLVDWNDTKREYDEGKSIHELFESQVERTPDAVAAHFEGKQVTYAELNECANQLAHHLRKLGVGADVVVGVYLERSLEMLVGLLGIMKAGAAYVSLDPAFPKERLAFMLEDAQVKTVVTQRKLLGDLPERGVPAVCLDSDWSAIARESKENLTCDATPQSRAYVIYTSGSTGKPKGVEISHRAVVNFLSSMREQPGMTERDVLLAVTTISFDIAGLELYLPLVVGGRVVIASREVPMDGVRLSQFITDSKATVMQATPATWRMLIDVGWSGRKDLKIFCGGEALPAELAKQLLERSESLWNLYGPTESTIWSTLYQVETVDGAVPIGRPIANTEIYILDRYLKPVPVGVPGELYIGGAGLARGYLNRAELTEEKFIRHPFSADAQARLYKTGDLARYRSDGNIEYLGRLDQQVKLRGFRIELGEIEAVLSQHPGVRETVAVVREDEPGDRRLVAYIVPDQNSIPTANGLRDFIKSKLPEYMVPSAFVELDAMPLTPNGKIDRKALPVPGQNAMRLDSQFVAPRTALEQAVAGIWAQVLKVERVGAHDNFFELGGHSLLATQVVFRASAAFGVELPLATFFQAPTVVEMAAAITRYQSVNAKEGVPRCAIGESDLRSDSSSEQLPLIVSAPSEKYDPFPLTDVQEAYWVGRNANFALGNVATHVYLEIESDSLDLERYQLVWQRLIERHDMLRAIILPDGRQQILEQVPPFKIETVDLRRLDSASKTKKLDAIRERMSHQVLKTDQWPLFEIRASLLEDRLVRLHISADFLNIDAWSWSILSREMFQLYQSPDAVLPPLEISFRDYVLAEIALRDSAQYRRSKDYWWNRLATLPPAPELPLAKDPGSISSPRFVRRSARLEANCWSRLKQRTARSGLTPSGLLLGVFSEILKVWSKSPTFTINLTLFSRLPLHPQVNDIVGDSTSLTLLAVNNSVEKSFEARAKQLQQQLWQDLDHSRVSGVRVMRELARKQGTMPSGVMPVVFTSIIGQESSVDLSAATGKVAYSVSQTPQVWLDHQVLENNGSLVFNWDAVEELFPAGMLDDMFDSYCGFLRRLADDESAWQESWPETTRKLLPVWQLEQRAEVNDTGAPLTDDLLHTLFAEQVPQRPQQPAVISSGRTLTYEELYRRGNQIGHWLRRNGARRNTLVAVVMEKGWEQVAGVLGVLASGAAYLPIDAGLPKDRLWHLLQHGEVTLVLTQPQFDKKIEWPETVKQLIIADDSLSGLSEQPLEAIQSPEDIAYVIYTSGSTGLPKGVVIDHRGAVNTILDLNQRFDVNAGDRVLALSSLSFDLSVYDIFGLLGAGGTIVVPDAAGLRDPAHWADLIVRHRVTLWNSVPALMQMLVEFLEGRGQILGQDLRLIFMSGDWIPVALPDRIRALIAGVQIISMGGATEASIWSIIYPIEKVDPAWRSIPYGRPMLNQTFHVLNDALEPCPVWVPGQLYIGGVGLAKGYWRDEEKTRLSFIGHPRTGERLYRTGDQGRYLPDGNIEFLGRDDFQVKVQGYRVELEEIEAVLAQHPGVRSPIVTAVGQAFGDKRLVAYLVPKHDSSPTISELTGFLREHLPEYMLPSDYVMLDHLPLSSNGKVDRKALPEPATLNAEPVQNSSTDVTSQAAQTSRICNLMAEVLKVKDIDAKANLLNLGATSIDMIRIVNLMEHELGFRPKIDLLYRLPTVAALIHSYEQHLLLQSPFQQSPVAITQGDYEEGKL